MIKISDDLNKHNRGFLRTASPVFWFENDRNHATCQSSIDRYRKDHVVQATEIDYIGLCEISQGIKLLTERR